MLASLLPLLPLALTLFQPTLAQTVKYEAEDGTLTGATMTVDTAFTGYSGTGYVTGFEDSTCSLTITVTAASTGLYDFNVTYEAPYGEKYTAVSLNGVSNGELHFPATTAFTTVSGGQLLLNAGTNTITFTDDWGWYLIDYITLAPSAAPAPHQVTSSLTNANANSITKTLMSFLVSQYGKHILSGQQDPPSYAWVQQNIDKSPAIIGLDLIDYSPSRVAFQGNVSHAVEDAISFDGNETIVCFVWHWNAPTNLTNSVAEPWYSGFYTAATTFDLATALAEGVNGTDYQLLIRDMDAIAYELGRLQTAGVPVLWRPLHEAEGGWFWWGRNQDPTPCIQLYRIMYDRFTRVHGLNNLIWVWNSVSSAWYPGDDVVDILSYDSYPSTVGDHGAVSGVYQQLVTLGQDKKLIALAEVGEIPDPALEQAYHADWSYWVTWSGDYISSGSHNSFAFLVNTYWSDYVWNWENIQGWKQGAVITPSTTGIRPTVPSTTSTTSSATPSSTVVVPSNAVVYEAENGVFTGTVGVATTATGYSGTGYVAGFATSNDTLTITVTVATAGNYDLYVTYEAPYGLKYTALSVNGVSVGEVYFPANTYFDTVSGGVIALNSGANTITFTNDWGWYFIDKIAIAPDSPVVSSTTSSSTSSSNSVVTSSSKTSSTVKSSSSSVKSSSTTSSTKTSSSTKPTSSSSTKTSSSTKPTSSSSSVKSSSSIKSSSSSTKTSSSTKASSSTTSSASAPTQTLYGQCGGLTYKGPTVCATGSTCVYQNPYYSQCLAQ